MRHRQETNRLNGWHEGDFDVTDPEDLVTPIFGSESETPTPPPDWVVKAWEKAARESLAREAATDGI